MTNSNRSSVQDNSICDLVLLGYPEICVGTVPLVKFTFLAPKNPIIFEKYETSKLYLNNV